MYFLYKNKIQYKLNLFSLVLKHSNKLLKNYKFNIIFSSYDYNLLLNNLNKTLCELYMVFGLLDYKIYYYPKKRSFKLTVIRSPFVNKKSKDQFELKYFKANTNFYFSNKISFIFFKKKISLFNNFNYSFIV